MFKVKKKILIFITFLSFFLSLISLSIPAVRAPYLSALKHPLILLTKIGQEFSAIIFYHRNSTQNTILKKEIDFLRNKLNACEENNLENIRLKELLSFKKNSQFKFIASRVIARSPDSWSSNLIIDKGSRNGIKRGMACVTYLGLVGRVIETQGGTSNILLINDPNLSISAMAQRSRQEGLVSGTLGEHLIMKYLPEEPDITVGDTIISSGLNKTYPKGLLIGKVTYIGKEFSGLSSFAIIKPVVNLSNIEEVLIIVG